MIMLMIMISLCCKMFFHWNIFKNQWKMVSQPHFGQSGRMQLPLPKVGNLESFGTPENPEDDLRGQISSHWCILYVIRKVLKCRCPKWPRMSHLDICNPKLWAKEGSGVKLAVWLLTTKSQESTSSRSLI